LSVKAVSLDFWNTLYMEDDGGFVFYNERRLLLLTEALSACGAFGSELIEHACRLEGERQHDIWRYEHRTRSVAERLDCILADLDASVPDERKAQLITAFEEGILERPPILIPGAREAVELLSARYRLGIISDVGFSPGRVLKEIIRRSGLLGAFDSLVFSDEAGHSKPHNTVFEFTARQLQTEPNEIVHVGDLEHTDIVGAKRAGYKAIRFTGVTPMSGDEYTIADRTTSDLTQLPALIESLE
jgi:FMN phosphatase YigB (HAD superfamily)